MISAAGYFGLTLRSSYQLDESVRNDLLVLEYGGVKESEIEPAELQLRRLYDAVAVHSTVE
ncbi:hypothetical protein ABH912_000449 [Pseudomonas sp. BT76 TE3572]|uniref:hypothetical protein n=1 Tax=Pseudomonas sp. BT76 TE3572 TaxID=3349325 RepID=UPI003D1D8F65